MILFAGLFIYGFVLWCDFMKFFLISFVFPIYGILCNIVTLILLSKGRTEWECSRDNSMNQYLESEIKDNNDTIALMVYISFGFIAACFAVLLYSYCKEKNKRQ